MLPENYFFNLLRSLTTIIIGFSLVILCFSFISKNKFAIPINIINCSLSISLILTGIHYKRYNKDEKIDLKVAHFNVLKHNKTYQEIIDLAITTSSDIISFQEVDSPWIKNLTDQLIHLYPYSTSIARDNNCFGIAIFSKYPLLNIDHIQLGGFPNISGSIKKKNKQINFITSHTIPPTTDKNFKKRNKHIQEIATHLNSLAPPKIAIGDYNAVPWDQQIINFKSHCNLKSSRNGLSPTYPSWLPFPIIPIDYIFHSSTIVCTNFETIKTKHSDHYGIIGSYQFKE